MPNAKAMTSVTEPASFADYKAALRQVYFLKTLSEDAIEELAAAAMERTLNKGETLFLERERCLGLIVVLSGAIKVYKLVTKLDRILAPTTVGAQPQAPER